MIEITQIDQGIKSNINRVVLLPFDIKNSRFNNELFDKISSLSKRECNKELREVLKLFSNRHRKIEDQFLTNLYSAAKLCKYDLDSLSEQKKILLGAYLSLEYSIEAIALFNPSIVSHPVQKNLPKKSQRIVMSMRAVGEGHVSSLVFRTGILTKENELLPDPPSSLFSSRAKVKLDSHYEKHIIEKKLHEIGINSLFYERLFSALPESFTMDRLEQTISKIIEDDQELLKYKKEIKFIRILAKSNYKLNLDQNDSISDLIVFPHSPIEVHGIEDLRLTLFKEEKGDDIYYGTYTAYNGFSVMPMLLETKDFRTVLIHTLNGACAKNKGLALFPRRIKGHYVMCSRIDGHNLYIMYSDHIHFWESATLLAKPKYPWELRLIGNCGSPHETKEGWLLLTHGVGPMRKYSIGAMLLDLENPLKIRGRLKEPLLLTKEKDREGSVPNVVYTCGSIIHNDRLFIPYGVADTTIKFAHLDLNDLVSTLIKEGV